MAQGHTASEGIAGTLWPMASWSVWAGTLDAWVLRLSLRLEVAKDTWVFTLSVSGYITLDKSSHLSDLISSFVK